MQKSYCTGLTDDAYSHMLKQKYMDNLMPQNDYSNEILSLQDNLLYIRPDESLRRFVAHYTLALHGIKPKTDSLELIPDAGGCIVITKHQDGRDEYILWGPTTQKVTVTNNNHTFPLRLFIEFLPGGLYKLAGINIKTLENKFVELNTVNAPLEDKLRLAINNADSAKEMTDNINCILFGEFEKHAINPVCLSLIDMVINGAANVDDIAKNLFISQRQLNRISNKYLGLSVKSFCEVVRLNGVVSHIKRQGSTKCAEAFDYYDYSHCSNQIKSVCGLPPGKLQKAADRFYNEPYKY